MQSLDQPLDAIIQSKRKQRQPNRRQRGSRPQSAKQAAGVAQPEPAVAPAQAVAAQVHVGDKIIVSNLPEDVNEQQIKELFHTTVGVVRSVNLSYNAQGKSKGIATIQFQRAEFATAAYQQYNKRLIDGS
ncbi:RNA-binding protein YRA1 [Sporobolomyces salmoneus]|uniref:RNA-binding protein YRA1 n=1 Tax=Sporobolomyces salmoneus TaxID=183962 RepID=UPI003181050E